MILNESGTRSWDAQGGDWGMVHGEEDQAVLNLLVLQPVTLPGNVV